MKVVKYNKLLSSLLTSDLIYFPVTNSKKKDLNYYSKKIEINKSSSYVLLNVFVLLQSLKQIIRLLQFNLKHYKNSVQVITSNPLYNQIIDYVSKAHGIKDSKINARLKFDNKLNSKVIVAIGNDTALNTSYLIQKLSNNNINSIILINTLFSKNLFGNYKLFNNINNYKKLMFLLVIFLLSQKQTDFNSSISTNSSFKKN